MQCKVDDCGRPARYKSACLCQKHYFRMWRYGTTETTRAGKGATRRVMPGRGYIHVKRPEHPLAHESGWVAEHRAIVYDDLGPGPMNCELCGVIVTWEAVHIDHRDDDPANNARPNLRPTCCVCNTRRGMRAPAEWSKSHKITYGGVTMTPAEWARDQRVSLSGHQIIARKASGMSDEDALFAPKRTHNGKTKIRSRPYKPFTYYEHDGKRLTLGQWAREPGVSVTATAIKQRMQKGWALAEALFTPPTKCTPEIRDTYRAKARGMVTQGLS